MDLYYLIIKKSLKRRYEDVSLKELDDSMEEYAKKELLENLGYNKR